MKRTIVFLAVAAVAFCGMTAGVLAQQQQPASAPGDSLKATGQEAPPATGIETMAAPDTTVAPVVKHRRQERMMYYASLGLGSAYNYLPDSFNHDFSPSFGLGVAGGVTKYNLRLGISASFNFFLKKGIVTLHPDDMNIFTVFGELRYVPLESVIRPFVLGCGGYYRQWIIHEDYVENVLGYGGGAGIEIQIDKVRRLYIEGRYIQGRTRQTEKESNTELMPFLIGVTWVF